MSPGGSPLKVYVGNLSPECRMFHLRDKFTPFGEITNVELKPNLGFGFVVCSLLLDCYASILRLGFA